MSKHPPISNGNGDDCVDRGNLNNEVLCEVIVEAGTLVEALRHQEGFVAFNGSIRAFFDVKRTPKSNDVHYQ